MKAQDGSLVEKGKVSCPRSHSKLLATLGLGTRIPNPRLACLAAGQLTVVERTSRHLTQGDLALSARRDRDRGCDRVRDIKAANETESET